jgi:hypothetical protein
MLPLSGERSARNPNRANDFARRTILVFFSTV